MKAILTTLLLCLLLSPWESVQARPKIGLVLGGGGAAGISHVGVLKVLEANHIPIDYIAGNSMGAIIGSLYASGMSADEIEHIALTLDWPKLFQDDPGYNLKSYQQKQQSADFFNTLSFGVSKQGVKWPGGLIDGQRLMFELRRLLAPVQKYNNFDDLPIPFRAVATDIRTGETVVLKQGNLATAVRASMSIPGVFAPVTIDGRLLVDGLVSNNVPVDVARDMGADILIVSRIPQGTARELNSALDISLQTMDILMSKTSADQLKTLTNKDILIEPPIGDIGSLDFNRVAETIPIGEKGAHAKLAALQQLAKQLGTTKQALAREPKPNIMDKMRIASVSINNNSVLDTSILRQKLAIQEGDIVDAKQLQEALDRVYSLGYFSLVDYDLIALENGSYELKVIANKSSQGDQRINIGFSLGDDFNGDTSYQAGAKYVRKGLTDKGTELRIEGAIGNNILAQTELVHPLRKEKKDTFIAPQLWYRERDAAVFADTRQIADIRAREAGIGVDVGRAVGNWAEARVGLFSRKIKPKVKTGTYELADTDIHEAGVKFQYNADSLDSINFPTSGGRFSASLSRGFKQLGSDKNFSRLEVNGERVWTKDKHHFIASGSMVANTNNENGLLYNNSGVLQSGRLAFNNSNEWQGNYALETSGTYMRQIAEIPNLAKVHVGAAIGLGQEWQKADEVNASDLRTSSTIFLGGETAIGPAFVGVRKTAGFDKQLYFNFGRDF